MPRIRPVPDGPELHPTDLFVLISPESVGRMNQDASHLRLLAIFHYVLAAGSALFSSAFVLHFVWGLATVRGEQLSAAPPPKVPMPPGFGIMMMVMSGGAVLLGWAFAACLVLAGRSLTARKRHTFCLVIAGVTCLLCNPVGTVLGGLTIVVLLRPSVKELFGLTQTHG